MFENRSLGERIQGERVRDHIAAIFKSWPGLALRFHSRDVSGDVVVQEWTLTAMHGSTGKPAEWQGVDLITVTDGLIARKAFYWGGGARTAWSLSRRQRRRRRQSSRPGRHRWLDAAHGRRPKVGVDLQAGSGLSLTTTVRSRHSGH